MAPSLIVVGSSLGGFHALRELLAGLPRHFTVPVVIVQHRTKEPDETLKNQLQSECALPLSEPDDKEPLAAGHVYLAPPDYHLLVEGKALALSTEGPIHFARPSVDALFESAAAAYGKGVVGVVLTGSSRDGASGAARIKQHGGLLVVQDPNSAEAREMPDGAIAAAKVDKVLPLPQIAKFLVGLSAADSSEPAT